MQRTVAFVWVAFVLAVGCEGQDNIEEIACDEAVAKLVECCDGFAKESIRCRVQRSGCDPERSSEVGVEITLRDADTCILHSSCDDIRANGVCDSATAATAARSVHVDGKGTTTYERVSACPQLRSE